MAKPLVVLMAVALTGCFNPYRRPTLVKGGDIALTKPTTPTEAIVGALLCSKAKGVDSVKVGAQGCKPLAVDSAPAPTSVPGRKP